MPMTSNRNRSDGSTAGRQRLRSNRLVPGLIGLLALSACSTVGDAASPTSEVPAETSTAVTAVTSTSTAIDEGDGADDPMVLPAEVVSIRDMIDRGFDPIGGCSFVDDSLGETTFLVSIEGDGVVVIDGEPVMVEPLDDAMTGPVPTASVGDTADSTWIVQFTQLGDEEVIGIGESSSWPAAISVGEYLHAGRGYEAEGTLFCGV